MIKKFIPCRKCKARGAVPEGFYKDTTIKDGIKYNVIVECKHHKEWANLNNAYNEFVSSGFNREFFDSPPYIGTKSIDNINRLEKYVQNFNDIRVQQSILYFTGLPGAQKTVTANKVASQLISKGYNVKYILMHNLVSMLWNSQRDEELVEELKKYSECDLLIIDESFDKDKVAIWSSGKQLSFIDTFIRERINQNKGIIFISNKQPNQIEKEGFSMYIMNLVQRELQKRDSLFFFNDVWANLQSEPPEVLF